MFLCVSVPSVIQAKLNQRAKVVPTQPNPIWKKSHTLSKPITFCCEFNKFSLIWNRIWALLFQQWTLLRLHRDWDDRQKRGREFACWKIVNFILNCFCGYVRFSFPYYYYYSYYCFCCYYIICCLLFCVCVCRFPQKNARIKREMCRKRDTRMKTFGLWNRMTKAIFDLTSAYPYWQFQAIAMRTNVRKKCCLKPTFKCIFHIRHVHQTKRYLDVSMLFSRNKTNGETRTHLNKNVFIEDLAFVCRCRRCSHRHWQCCG